MSLTGPLFARLSRPALRSRVALRSLSYTPRCLADDHHFEPPMLFGSGAPAGAVPNDEQQATGLERLQLLGKKEGVDVFLRKPDLSKKGTMESPMLIPSLSKTRIVGCTGYPPEEHRTLWITLHDNDKKGRCKECGNVFKLDFQGEEPSDDHLHH